MTAFVPVVVVTCTSFDMSLPDGVRGEVDAVQPPDPLIERKDGPEKQARTTDLDTISALDNRLITLTTR
jgi:hypothetical protein